MSFFFVLQLRIFFLSFMQEKLWSMLKDVLKNKPNVDVVKLQKSGGVVSRNAKVRQKSRSHRIKVSSNLYGHLVGNLFLIYIFLSLSF